MILANLNDPNLPYLLPGGVWSEAIEWIRDKSATAKLGIHKLRSDLLFVNVMSYETMPRKDCRFESHREYIDLQFTINGLELIDYCNYSNLEKDGKYDATSDLQFYKDSPPESTLQIGGKTFCVFYPEDAHRPKIALENPGKLKKLVIKINLELLRNE